MRTRSTIRLFIIFLSLFFSAFVCGCDVSSEDGTLSVVIEGDAAAKAQLESLLKSNPVVIKAPSGIEYKLKIVKPDPRIDYNMVIIEPKDDIDYSIIVVDPEKREEISKLSPKIRDELLKLLEQKKDRQKK
ncbi:hypothetical protein LCGC14_2946210 [marine sediment metagenome]|uniref:Lipoprotein n=1 Tax=marine sediment metagenome TaxID=412755 RepID=A0A0F8Y3N6_9ZZZZ|nr:hypothetical protein [Phycisphaerales bacterium]